MIRGTTMARRTFVSFVSRLTVVAVEDGHTNLCGPPYIATHSPATAKDANVSARHSQITTMSITSSSSHVSQWEALPGSRPFAITTGMPQISKASLSL